MSLRELGLPYSTEERNRIKDLLIERLHDFKQRELPENAFVLFIDAYHTEIQENLKIRKACVYTVMGIDLEGRKDVYGYHTFFGSESRTDWLRVFNDLIERGLKRVVLIVSDDFPGMDSALKALFPRTEHQLSLFICRETRVRTWGKRMPLHSESLEPYENPGLRRSKGAI
jgi:putative transposase